MNLSDKIKKLCEGVIETPTILYDNPNGPYESTCPFCNQTEWRGGGGMFHVPISEIEHSSDCIYLIAVDLLKEE